MNRVADQKKIYKKIPIRYSPIQEAIQQSKNRTGRIGHFYLMIYFDPTRSDPYKRN